MCNVLVLSECERRVNVETCDGRSFCSDWYVDDKIKADGVARCTTEELTRYNTILEENQINKEDVKTWHVSRKREPGNVYVSEHAFLRMKERCGLNKKATLRHIKKVYDDGVKLGDAKGYIKPWAKQREERCADGEFSIMYGDFVYIFCHDTFVTVIHKPQKGKVTFANNQ